MIRQVILRPAATTTRRMLATPIAQATPFMSARFLSTQTATETANAIPPPPTSPSAKSASTQVVPAPKPRRLTYLVERTHSKSLPVYDDSKSGGTNKFTQIRKIVGNAQALKKDIIQDFGFKKDNVNVNPVTGHLVIKGHHQKDIKKWLEARGF